MLGGNGRDRCAPQDPCWGLPALGLTVSHRHGRPEQSFPEAKGPPTHTLATERGALPERLDSSAIPSEAFAPPQTTEAGITTSQTRRLWHAEEEGPGPIPSTDVPLES